MPSIPTDALLDVNVIIASVFADHVMHLPARRFIESLQRFYTTPTVQGGFLRFATRPLKDQQGELKQPRLTMATAHAKLEEFTTLDRHVFVPDDAPFTELATWSLQGHRQWTDAYLLHVARKHDLMLASLESRMATIDDPSFPVLFVVAG